MSVKIQDQEDIAIFWDYESTKSNILRADISTSDVVQNIRSAVSPFGTIKSFRAYSNLNTGQVLSKLANVRSDLFASGVTLVDCPGEGRKEFAVKIMLVDMIAHAWSHSTPHTFVIITGDRDVAYGISTLRMRKYRVVVISPTGTRSDLKVQASIHLDWNDSVLGIHEDIAYPEDIFADMPTQPRPPSSSYPQQSQPPTSNSTSFTQIGRQSLNGFARKASESQRVSELESFELHDLPARGRRNSIFSTFDPRKFDGFGDLGDAFMTPKSHRNSSGLGEVPFLRPQSRETQSRADSAPPNIAYSSNSMKPSYPSRTPEKGSLAGLANAPAWKGKSREFPFFEPEYIAPQVPMESTRDVSYSRSLFESLGDIKPSVGPASTVVPSTNTGQPLQNLSSSSSSSKSSGTSPSSTVKYPEASTAPTSANIATNGDKIAPPAQRAIVEDEVTPSQRKDSVASAPDTYKKSIEDAFLMEPAGMIQETKEKNIETASATVEQPVANSSTSTPFSAPSKTSVLAIQRPATSSPTSQLTTKTASTPQPAVASTSTSHQTVPIPAAATPKTVPLTGPAVRFQTLVDVLRRDQRNYSNGIPKTVLGASLLQKNPQVYKISGLKKFGQYISAAVGAGIIKETQGGDSVVLLPPHSVS